ncbi:biotin--protein ligase [Tupanvirus soda lake]|uniref:Biotin--protein ligase n=2 Tax=Tupanvirus TaxID=2094720 RepID=A0A6N1NVB6_9VIRU|nr:biotin--protein ligase [Tupanvirus soda lake]QKU35293.1 biotin--protein ligase [Tupanvirus soda lake]
MENYKQKYIKYKAKYTDLKKEIGTDIATISGGDSNFDDPMSQIENLVIYPQKALVTTQFEPPQKILLPEFVKDSITFFNENGEISKASIFIDKDTYENKISKNYEILVTLDDNSQVKGTVESVDPKIITIINEQNELIIIRKWKNAKMLSGRHSKPTILSKEMGTVQYIVNSIGWVPIYNLYLDNQNLEEANGLLYFMALINNSTGYNINAKNTILITGDTKMQTSSRSRSRNTKFTAMELSAVPSNNEGENIEQMPLDELLTYNIKKQYLSGEEISFPIHIFDLKNITKKYIIDTNIYTEGEKQYVEANYGYKIPISEIDLPAGLLRLFVKSSNLNTTLMLGSVNVLRTPKNTPMEIMLGKTPRIRAKLAKEINSTETENGIIKKIKYTTTNNRLYGVIINGTEKVQEVTLRDYIGNATIISADSEPIKKQGYLEWVFKIKPGELNINLNFQLKY